MGDFDPDAYLADSSGPSAAPEENSFDPDKYLANFNPDEYLRSDQRPAPEGPVMSGLREAAHAAIPAAAGLVGAGLGAAAGALTSPVTGPVGPFVGGVGGMVAASMGADYVQSKALKWAGIDDDTQRAANIEANPKSSFIGGLAPAAATMSPIKGAQLAQRALGGAMMGGFEAGQEYLNEGNVDPTKVGIAAAVGAVAPAANRLGEKLMGSGARMVPGRPNRTANPDANQAHADVDDATPETAVGDSSLAEPPPGPDGVTTGNPQSAPERSDRVYPKENTAAPAEGDMLTQGHMDPATAAALDANQPATPSPAPEAAAPTPAPQPAGPNAAKPTLGLKPRPEPVVSDRRYVQAMNGNPTGEPLPRLSPEGLEKLRALKARFAEENAAPPVETGFPKPGEPVAVGENEATPMPQRDTAPKLDEVMKRLKGKTNPEPTEGQKEAGNYEKARERLFGHEVAYENMKGSERTGTDAEGKPWSSTLPADYGYFRKTVGADKDHVDVYNLRNGDKHFIVDQRNPDTGKFDEHKVMANAKDLDDARDTYLKGFSDEKGLARLHDITEVSPDELTQWLKGASKKKPYGAPVPPLAKPVKERAVVQDTVQKLRAQGKDAEADQLLAAPDEQVAKAIEGKRTRKYGVPSKTGFSANFPVDGLPGSTANTKPLAAARSRGHKAVVDWYENSSLPGQLKPDDETNGELLDRIKGPKEALKPEGWDRGPAKPPKEWMWAKEAKKVLSKATPANIKKFREAERLLRGNDTDVENYRGGNRVDADIALNRNAGDKAVGVAENQRANEGGLNTEEDKMAEYLDTKNTVKLVKAGKDKFHILDSDGKVIAHADIGTTTELKSGKKYAAIEDINTPALENVKTQEEHNAVVAAARNSLGPTKIRQVMRQFLDMHPDVEGFMGNRVSGARNGGHMSSDNIQNVSVNARKTRFDVPHEEAESMVEPTPVRTKADLKELPRKTIDSGDTDLAKIDTNKISATAMRKAEAEKLAGKKSDTGEVYGPPRIRKIDISDPARLKELIELSNKAAKKRSVSEEDLAKEDLAQMPSGKPAYNETARLFDRFASNEDASLNLGKIKADLKRLKDNLTTTTPVKSYIARPVHPTLEPHGDYTRGLSDELHTLENMNTRHEQNIKRDFIRKLPKEANKDALQRIFKAREADSAHVDLPGKQAGKTNIESMSPSDKKVWDEHIKPMIDEANDFREQIKQIDQELAGPDVEHYIARITKGNTREFDLLRKSDDPVVRRNALAVHASMTNERPFVAIENQLTGERHVIQNRPEGGFTWWNNNKAIRVKDPNYEFEANKPYVIKNNKTGQSVPYIMRHATTDEIMKSGARFDLGKDKNGKKLTMPATYYQNAALSAALAHAKLGAMARNIIELGRLSSTPEFQALSTSRPTKEQIAEGWKESTMPNFKGISMAPELREVFDDYAGRAGDSFDNLRRLNQAVTKMLFWMPIAHIMNVGAHWFVGRGWDNLNVKRGLTTSMKAMQSVIKQDHIQKEMMENGAGLIYPSVDTRNFIEQIAKGVGEKMSEDPKSGWRAIAQQAGVPFKALEDAVYHKFSSKTMWAANDMFLTQRYLELKEKGLSPKEAVSRAERDIPNYRVPTRLGGGGTNARALSLLAQDNTMFAFSRYHVGMMNAYSDMVRGAFSSKSTVGDRVEALGKMLALGALAAAYPIADKVAKAVTGNEDATQNRRGPLAIPYHLNRALQGKEDLASAGRATLTMQPLISTLMETYFNKDFRGKPIVEPGDVRQAFKGNGEAAGHVAKQVIGHAARGLISPLNTAVTAYKKKVNGEQQGIGTAVRDQALDIRNPSDKAVKYERMVPIKTFRDANTRHKQGDW